MPTLMVSVSGIRGIIGDGLDPNTLVKYTSAYADFCGKGKIVIGSDGRISGNMVKNIVIGTLLAKGNDVIDIGICPTPTVLYNVQKLGAVGGIIIISGLGAYWFWKQIQKNIKIYTMKKGKRIKKPPFHWNTKKLN